MKKLKGITRTLVCIGVFIAVAACESTDCPINNTFTARMDSMPPRMKGKDKIQVLDTLTITAAGTDFHFDQSSGTRKWGGTSGKLQCSNRHAHLSLYWYDEPYTERHHLDYKENISALRIPYLSGFDVPPCDRRSLDPTACRLRFDCKSEHQL